MKYEIRSIYQVSETHEFSVDFGGYNFLVIFGHHINGWFIAIPNFNLCVEAAEPSDIFYNSEKLSAVIDIPDASVAIANAINEFSNIL